MIDITRPIYPGLPVWPDDTPYSYQLGTHLDAPCHYVEEGGSSRASRSRYW